MDSSCVPDVDIHAAVAVGPEWSEVTIPFASLRQVGFGKSVPWSPDDVTGINVDARNNPFGGSAFGEFELEIDWIRLY